VFIEFKTPSESPKFLTGHLLRMVESEIKEWAQSNEIPYTCKYYKHTFRVAFDNDKHYTIFRLTWQDVPHTEYQLIDRRW